MTFPEFLASLMRSEVFVGIVGGAGISTLIWRGGAALRFLWDAVLRQVTITLVIDNSDDLFDLIAVYFSQSAYVRKSRWLRMAQLYDEEEQTWRWRVSFGDGRHLIRDGGHWFLFYRGTEEKAAGLTLKRRETLTIRTLGRSQDAMRGLMARAEKVYEGGETIRVYVWHVGGYLMADRKPKRDLSTIFIPAEQKDALFLDLHRWEGSRDRYRRRGTPWRRGYLLEGPPGTGKTTLAFAMACELNRPVYLLNLATVGGDTGLQAAFNHAEAGAVIVIEDIDSATISHQREKVEAKVPGATLEPAENVTLAGLLNAIDGLASRENRVLVMTSNRADVLDAALLRPGRIDRREYIGLLGEPEAREMCAAFLNGRGPTFYDENVASRLPLPPAELQGMLLAAGEQ